MFRRSLLICTVFFAVLPLAAVVPAFRIVGADQKPWSDVFGCIGISESAAESALLIVTGSNATSDMARLAEDHILILQGDSPLARQFGIVPQSERVPVRRIVDSHAAEVQIIWAEQPATPFFTLPAGFEVFAKERWKDAPVEAGKRTSHGAILWLATSPGTKGTERYPYLLQALSDLGLLAPLHSTGLWAFFDSAYRSRADVDYLAQRWRRTGIAALHVAAWHNMEPDAQRDEYLTNLIAACHRNAILVYAWLELPHVSDEFWAKHPEWREKTAVGEDAQLDWRKLMNLQNPDCKRAVAQQVRQLLRRFDWDGVNLAELYFESLEGASNPARFTPMNDDVRREFQEQAGFDPKRLFDPSPAVSAAHREDNLRTFLDFRARLASRMQSDWLDVADQMRSQKPYLDVVVTHIDDRLEPGMRDALGAETSRSLPYLQSHRAAVLVEDPAPLWNLGAARYRKLAEKWDDLGLEPARIAVDINVVERYQDVYPTKKQTGTELFELVHQAARSFSRVALYFENSIERPDLALLPVAATDAQLTETAPDEVEIMSAHPVRLLWRGAAEVDGKPWPFVNETSALVPSGKHRVSAGITDPPVKIFDFNGNLGSVAVEGESVEFAYNNAIRAIVTLGSGTSSVDLDGTPFWKPDPNQQHPSILLPAGEHVVSVHR
jgi:hypothetical protein